MTNSTTNNIKAVDPAAQLALNTNAPATVPMLSTRVPTVPAPPLDTMVEHPTKVSATEVTTTVARGISTTTSMPDLSKNKPMKRKTKKQKSMNNRQKNKLKNEMNAAMADVFAEIMVMECAEKPIPNTMTIFNGILLHAMMPTSLEFPEWKEKFVRENADIGIVAVIDPSDDFAIPLHIARRHVIANSSYYGLLAYIAIREAEASKDGFISHLNSEFALEIYYLYPDSIDHISARALHHFLKSDQSFDAWKAEMIERSRLIHGHDYFSESTSHNPHRKKSKIPPHTNEDVRLTIEATIRIGVATPTARGKYILEYFAELKPSVSIPPIK